MKTKSVISQVIFLTGLALVIAFTSADALALPTLQNRYIHGEPFNAISYDAFLDRRLITNPDAVRRHIMAELLERFRYEDHAVTFRLYVIDVAFVPLKAGDMPRTIEIPRREIEILANAVMPLTITARQGGIDVPLPELNIVNPPPGVPNAEFVGVWTGRWDNVLPHVLVVEELLGVEAIIVYAYGSAPVWRIYEPGWFRAKARFLEGGILEVPTRQGGRATYQMHGKRLKATYEAPGAFSRAWLDKMTQQ